MDKLQQAFPAVTNDGYKEGMTLRDWFAGQAMVALTVNASHDFSHVAWCAYQQSDAMLAEREENQPADPLRDAAHELLEALELARNGLIWYKETHPTDASGCDDEAMQQIDAAIAKATGREAGQS